MTLLLLDVSFLLSEVTDRRGVRELGFRFCVENVKNLPVEGFRKVPVVIWASF